MKQKGLFNTVFARIYLILALIAIPAFALNEGLKHFADGNREIAIKSAAPRLADISAELIFHANTHDFWLDKLGAMFAEANSPKRFLENMSNLLTQLDFAADVIVYDGNGNFTADNFDRVFNHREAWKKAGKPLERIIGSQNSLARFAEIDELRPLFGRHFYSHVGGQFEEHSLSPVLYVTDFSNDKYRLWFGKKSSLIAVVRFDADALKQMIGLRHFMQKNSGSDLKMAVFKNSIYRSSQFSPTQARAIFNQLERNPKDDYVCSQNHIYGKVQINPSTQVLLKLPLADTDVNSGKITSMAACLVIFFLLLALKNEWLPKRIEDLSLLIQIIILIAVTTGIPLMILSFIGTGYFNNKKTMLVNLKNRKMVNFVKQIDQNLDYEFARMNRHYYKVLKDFDESLKKPGDEIPVKEIANEFFKFAGSVEFRRQNQAISIPVPASMKNVFTEKYVKDRENTENVTKEDENISILADYHLATLNGRSPEEIRPDKEILVEMFFQKPIWMAVHELVKIEGAVSETSWGSQRVLTFIKALKLLSPKLFDGYLVIASAADGVARSFNRRVLQRILRNPFNFRVFVVGEGGILLNNNKSILLSPHIARLAKKVTRFPFSEPAIVDFADKPHIFVGLKSSRMNFYSYCVLFPLEVIQNEINREAKDLILIAGFATILVFFMILTLYLNLLLPVNRLHQAANALCNRDATFRLPQDGSDEFAEMAEIFNTSMAEFEELQIAGIVQKRLLPSKPLKIEGFSIYGKSIPMAFMGGDYFDCFSIDEDRFVMLLGDVAGHGVGAALIMAMAKAGVICADEFATDPATMLSRLHQIILAIKNKMQRKVMTFQYLYVERSSNKMVYANAGACSPVLVDSNAKTMRVIDHPSAVLGGFKKSTFNNLDLTIEPGQAIVFYTDGMVESRNESGRELGYDGLYDIFLKSYDDDAEKYYENISQSYLTWLGGMEAGDDLTIVIAVCNNRIKIPEAAKLF